MQISSECVMAGLAYMAISTRWFLVINAFHREVLRDDTSYVYKEHGVFKSMLLVRAMALALVAPLMAFVRPSYFDQFLNGVKT